jgi:hypothetical protein
MSDADTLIRVLNEEKQGVTWELVQCNPFRIPVVGEIRYVLPLISMPGQELESMMSSAIRPVSICWNGAQWVRLP